MGSRSKLAFITVNILLFISPNSALPDLGRAPQTSKSIVLDPFNHQFRLYPSYEPSIRSIIHNLESAGFTVDYYKDSNVTIDLLKRLDDERYGIIYINTHGFLDPEGSFVIFTGEKHTPEKGKLYREDMEEERIRQFELGGNLMGYYYVTPSFFTYYGKDTGYQSTLVLIDACHSANNTSMAEAFLDLDAACYVGWTAFVGVEYGVAADGRLFRQMCIDGETVEQSIRNVKPDPTSGSIMAYTGDGSLSLTAAPYEPESRRLPEWITVPALVIVVIFATGILYKFAKIRRTGLSK